MKKLLVLVSILAISCGKNTQNSTEIISSSIINGTPVALEDLEASSLVGVSDPSGYINLCTATLISEDLILTAAHCVSDWTEKKLFSKSKRVLAPRAYSFKSYQKDVPDIIIQSEGVELVSAATEKEEWSHDIAIVKLAGKIPAGFSPVAILDSTYKIPENTDIILAGFGFTSEFSGSDFNKDANKITRTFFEYGAENRIVNVSQVNGKEGVYHGDSGGPAYLESNGELLLVGSTVGGEGASLASFMNLGAFKTFILDAAKKLKATPPIFKIP